MNRVSQPSSLNQEREVKIAIQDADSARQSILASKFQEVTPRHLEINDVYDTADQSIRSRGELLRLRQAGSRHVLTFKGKSEASSAHKVREELEVTTSDGATTAAILNRLGFQPLFRYEKYRTEFAKSGEPGIVVLDETPIGNFLELEGDAEWIDQTALLLGYSAAHYITSSYGKLYRDLCIRMGVDPSHMIFSK